MKNNKFFPVPNLSYRMRLAIAFLVMISPYCSHAALTKFVDPLPIPPIAKPTTAGGNHYLITMQEIQQKLHRDLPPTTVWGYDGVYPGPTFKVKRGTPITVEWQNHLPVKHLLPLDHALHGAKPDKSGAPAPPDVKTAVHLHGGKVLPGSDGHPEAWYSPNYAETGPDFVSPIYAYPNAQRAATLWYHDHSLGTTRLNVYAGLAGLYLIRDQIEDALNLPRGRYDIPLIIQDRQFDLNSGALIYPTQTAADPEIPKIWVPEAFGDTILVNGKVWPFLRVEPRKYRFRLLNGSNARFYHLTLLESDKQGISQDQPGPVFHQIGTDGGLLSAPVELNELLIAPGERFDLVIDFSGLAGKAFLLHNDAKAPYPDGDDVIPAEVLLFKVTKPLQKPDNSTLSEKLATVSPLDVLSVSYQRDLTINEKASALDNPILGLLDNLHFDAPVVDEPKLGSIEIWRIINRTGDVHPLHEHPLQMQVLDRQSFNDEQSPANASYEQLVFTGMPMLPDANEQNAWKDTVKVYPGQVTRVIVKYTLPKGTETSPGQKFNYMWHCHILEHEDNEMMRPYNIVVNANNSLPVK